MAEAMTSDNKRHIYKAVAHFAQADLRQGVWQLVNTFGPYLALWVVMVATGLSEEPTRCA